MNPTAEQVQQWYDEWFNGNFDVKPEEYMVQRAFAAGAASMQSMQQGVSQARVDELESELDKAQDEINCAEASLEAFACEFEDEKFNQGFDCLGQYVTALHEAFKVERDALQSQLTEAQAALRSAQYAMEYAKDECEPTAQCELTIGLLNIQKALK